MTRTATTVAQLLAFALATSTLIACECTTVVNDNGSETTVCGSAATDLDVQQQQSTIPDDRADHRCGPDAGHAICGEARCCSSYGYCGGEDETHCGHDNGFSGMYDGPAYGSGYSGQSDPVVVITEPDDITVNDFGVTNFEGTWDLSVTLVGESDACDSPDDMPSNMVATVDQYSNTASVILSNDQGDIELDGGIDNGQLAVSYDESGDGVDISVSMTLRGLDAGGMSTDGGLNLRVSFAGMECHRQYELVATRR